MLIRSLSLPPTHQVCNDSYYESNMLICDLCDRASHAMCVGLKKVPEDSWFCKLCSVQKRYKYKVL